MKACVMSALRAGLVWTAALCSADIVGAAPPEGLSDLPPLNALGEQSYQGVVGGLYPQGKNEPSGAIAASLDRVSRQVRPLDSGGKPSSEGKIVVAGIGASVCRQIFAELEKQAPVASGMAPSVVFVNCALGGQDVNKIADPSQRYWNQAKATLAARGLTPQQVQVVWYQSDDLRDSRDDFPGRPERLKESLVQQMQLITQHFPHAKICYHSARHTTAFMPEGQGKAKHAEPRPYHVGWAVKWLLEDQAQDLAELAFEGNSPKAPLVAWATYFWTAGDQPRSDGYRWSRDDVVQDGVHLSPTAQTRVAKELLTFFATDPYAKTWFLAADSKSPAAKPAPATPAAAALPRPAKQAAADQPAWIVNGANKMPKLKRLVGENDFVRVVVRNLDGKIVVDINDVLNAHTDLNKVAGSGQFRLDFFDRENRPIKLSQPVGEVLRLK